MSISGITSSSSALIENALEATVAPSQQPSTSTPTNTPASTANTATSPLDTLTQDVVTLLKALATGNTTQAKSDLVKLKTDLKADSAAAPDNTLGKDVTTLLKNLTGSKDADVKTAQAPASSTPLDTLVSKLTDALNEGSVQGALQDLTKYLVQNGQSSGGLLNTTA